MTADDQKGAVPLDDVALAEDAETQLACLKLLCLVLAAEGCDLTAALAGQAPVLGALRAAPRAFRLPQAARAVLDAALAQLAEPVAPEPVNDGRDKRRQARISLAAPVRISDPDGGRSRNATLVNISWGGASIRCDEAADPVGATLSLHLPFRRGQTIPVLATLLRIEPSSSGVLYGLRFDSLAPEDEERLQEVLRVLLDSVPADGRRSESRLVQRLDIEYGDAGEFRATLEDISPSGLMLTVPEPLEPNQSLLVSLSCLEAPYNLSLRARVMHQTRLGPEGFFMYRVGVKFEHPDGTLRARVTEVLRHLAALPAAGAS